MSSKRKKCIRAIDTFLYFNQADFPQTSDTGIRMSGISTRQEYRQAR